MQTIETLKQWGAKLDEIAAKAKKAGAKAKTDHRHRVDDLKAKQQAAQSRLDELKTDGRENWESLKAGVGSVWDDLKGSFRK
jgi:hypothetical protein